MQATQTLYETDYTNWGAETVAQLQARDFTELDLEHPIEAVASWESSERHALASQWIRGIKHLLKLSRQLHTDNYHNSWVSSVVEGLDRFKQRLRCDFHRLKPVVASADERL
ncbi:DUF29 family protein [Synechococcus sp. PCC 6312]|uniref:DUF29 family protein n=1 Tax=Synechococcus sp. (strain ATCC 27167 / PCC 6312) TaxID=195253 RepID=UPI00029F1C25|nr:DUF29 family protein [Synechococcus sp. PCC 6312]AFY60415.1 protein of unknown function DUF29 [Synechococcus sp. PCC 6312]